MAPILFYGGLIKAAVVSERPLYISFGPWAHPLSSSSICFHVLGWSPTPDASLDEIVYRGYGVDIMPQPFTCGAFASFK